MTIIYMDADTKITEPDQWREADWHNWLSDAPIGSRPEGPLNPSSMRAQDSASSGQR